jgi:hypothetical protein
MDCKRGHYDVQGQLSCVELKSQCKLTCPSCMSLLSTTDRCYPKKYADPMNYCLRRMTPEECVKRHWTPVPMGSIRASCAESQRRDSYREAFVDPTMRSIMTCPTYDVMPGKTCQELCALSGDKFLKQHGNKCVCTSPGCKVPEFL